MLMMVVMVLVVVLMVMVMVVVVVVFGHYKDWIIYLTKASITVLLTLHDKYWGCQMSVSRQTYLVLV